MRPLFAWLKGRNLKQCFVVLFACTLLFVGGGAQAPPLGSVTVSLQPFEQFTTNAVTVDQSARSVVLTVTLSAGATQTETVQFGTVDGTAIAPANYTSTSGTLTFVPGDPLTQQIKISLGTGTPPGSTTTFTVVLSNPTGGVMIGTNSVVTVTITNVPPPTVQFSATSYSVNESVGSATILATLSATPAAAVTVNYTTSDGTDSNPAVAGINYTATSGTLTFNPTDANPTSQSFTVALINDGLSGPNRTLNLTLSSPSGATLATLSHATLTIVDDNLPPPHVAFSPRSVHVYEGRSVPLTARVTPSADISSVQFITVNSATATVSGTIPRLHVHGVNPGNTEVQAKFDGMTVAFVNVTVVSGDKKEKVVPGAATINPVSSGVRVDPTKAINQIYNPAGIVIEPETNRNADTAAIIQVDEPSIKPAGADANLLEWTIKSVKDNDDATNDANVEIERRADFLDNKNTGKMVRVYGIKEGRVRLEVWPKGADKTMIQNRLDYYEAWVVKPKQILFRVNILSGPTVKAPVKLAEAEQHVRIANIYLRQLGVSLSPDDNEEARKDPALSEDPVLLKKGYFSAKASKNSYVKDVDFSERDAFDYTTKINYRPKVVQISYIESLALGGSFGLTLYKPENDWGKEFDLVYRKFAKAAISTKTTMRMGRDGPPPETQADNWGLIITNETRARTIKEKNNQFVDQIFGLTIAHEMGHVMGLAHRANEDDGIRPVDTFGDPLYAVNWNSMDLNLMRQFADSRPDKNPTRPMDFDLIQLRAVQKCKALRALR